MICLWDQNIIGMILFLKRVDLLVTRFQWILPHFPIGHWSLREPPNEIYGTRLSGLGPFRRSAFLSSPFKSLWVLFCRLKIWTPREKSLKLSQNAQRLDPRIWAFRMRQNRTDSSWYLGFHWTWRCWLVCWKVGDNPTGCPLMKVGMVIW